MIHTYIHTHFSYSATSDISVRDADPPAKRCGKCKAPVDEAKRMLRCPMEAAETMHANFYFLFL